MSNKQSQIALFGTSADPPTKGHEALLKGLSTLFPRVVTWASDNPLKTHQIPLAKREALLNKLVKGINNPKLEYLKELSSPRAITTLEHASKVWPEAELIFVIGSDLLGQIPKWTKVEIIFNLARIGVAPRDGWPFQQKEIDAIKELGGRIDLLPLQIPASASSKIRRDIKPEQIPPTILPMLLEQNLYGINLKIKCK